ncbi:hypothetical protein QO010_003520 [Caulobacter ginsengisoli]|uniref:Uncharacterized protein n=1 Tax=Caulobacter ginsengisoli TaxID=400775 RepID=A0ABU0IUN2_9CAUL|nr:hypothetical protein [Caulobacter ginsengisoli]MDQ0465728.1 hypothetical protein [Caulobacter ginsengisoli]
MARDLGAALEDRGIVRGLMADRGFGDAKARRADVFEALRVAATAEWLDVLGLDLPTTQFCLGQMGGRSVSATARVGQVLGAVGLMTDGVPADAAARWACEAWLMGMLEARITLVWPKPGETFDRRRHEPARPLEGQAGRLRVARLRRPGFELGEEIYKALVDVTAGTQPPLPDIAADRRVKLQFLPLLVRASKVPLSMPPPPHPSSERPARPPPSRGATSIETAVQRFFDTLRRHGDAGQFRPEFELRRMEAGRGLGTAYGEDDLVLIFQIAHDLATETTGPAGSEALFRDLVAGSGLSHLSVFWPEGGTSSDLVDSVNGARGNTSTVSQVLAPGLKSEAEGRWPLVKAVIEWNK